MEPPLENLTSPLSFCSAIYGYSRRGVTMSKHLSALALIVLLVAVTIPATSLMPETRNPGSQQASPEKGREDAKPNNTAPQGVGVSIDSSVIASGGGTSTGSQFTLQGTIGQPAVVPQISGSNYTLSSGFWNAVSGTTVVIKKRGGQITSQ